MSTWHTCNLNLPMDPKLSAEKMKNKLIMNFGKQLEELELVDSIVTGLDGIGIEFDGGSSYSEVTQRIDLFERIADTLCADGKVATLFSRSDNGTSTWLIGRKVAVVAKAREELVSQLLALAEAIADIDVATKPCNSSYKYTLEES